MILIINMNQKEDSLAIAEFVMPIANVVAQTEKYEIKHYLELNEHELSKYSKMILSGTPLKDNEYLEHVDKFSWLKTINKPVLGICAGMQVIGLVFNSKLLKCQGTGMQKIKVVKENSLFSEDFNAYELHNQAVKPSDEFEVLAKSEKCVQAIKHKTRQVYGALFHPEVRNQEIIEKFLKT